MGVAISAKASRYLGASLIALTLPTMSVAAGLASNVSGIEGSSVSGIEGSSILGIEGSSANGIEGSSANGIEGSSANGIDGSSILGIEGSSILGIEGSSANGIEGSSANGIEGSSANGIDGSSILGIEGSSILGIEGSSANGIEGSSTNRFGDSLQVLAGPVDSVDRVNGVFESMGQVVLASQSMLASLQVGDFVEVGGSVVSSGWYYADVVNVTGVSYVPGSTEVFVAGMLSSIDSRHGTAQMGDLVIDYTSSLGGAEAPSGDMWSFHGTLPNHRGDVMISSRTAAIK